ncbi:MAG: EamA family transporter [Bacillota bacterium]|nr:EamA family transporter [Bacillota bacterium]
MSASFFRIVISIFLLLCMMLMFIRSELLRFNKLDIPIFIWFGFFMTMSQITYLSSLTLGIPASEAVFLTYTQPFFVIILSKFILNEKTTLTRIMSAILSIVGAAMILQIWLIKTVTYKHLIGYFLATLNGLFYASYIISGRYIGVKKRYNFIATTFWSFVSALIWLLLSWYLIKLIINDKDILSFTTALPFNAWILLIGLGFISTFLPFILLNKGLEQIKASQAGIILLIEPISVALMGNLILQQSLRFWQIIGAILILFSVIMINYETDN